MLTRIQVERFRGFGKLDVSCGALTAIIGKNSSGKTSVLQAVRLVRDALGLTLGDEDLRPQVRPGSDAIELCWQWVVLEPTKLVPLADWRQVFKDGEVREGVNLSVELSFAPTDSVQAIALALHFGRNSQLKMTLTVWSKTVAKVVAAIPRKSVHRPRRLLEELRKVTPIVFFAPAFYGVTRVEEYRTQPLVDRLLDSGDQSHIVRNLVARLDQAQIARMNGFLGRAVGARLVSRTAAADADDRPDLVVSYRDQNGELELSAAGAGLVGLMALFATMERIRSERTRTEHRPVIFLLDEPEAHLHPRLQGDVGDELAKLAAEFGVQLLLATHSIEMVNRLGRRPETSLVSVDRGGTPPAVTLRSEPEVIAALEEFCDLSPFTTLSFLSSRRVLFHEGPSDLKVLDACARVYFRSDDERLQRFQQYTPIPLEGVGNVPVAKLFERLLTPSLFPKVDARRPVRAAVALDRDFARPAKPPEAKDVAPHLQAIDVVWSRHCIESLFLDPPCLSAWLEPQVGLPAAELRPLVENAVRAADQAKALEDAAFDGRYAVHRRPDAEGKMATEQRARELTRQEIRADPATWQPGKRRASFLLNHIREALPKAARQRLRGTIDDILMAHAAEAVGDATVLVPAEIRAFLDLMVAP
jgi:energy-coupling factor transporter ATP-binding protein EcfA2